jgi:hypothetical protein
MKKIVFAIGVLYALCCFATEEPERSSILSTWENPDEVYLYGQGTPDHKMYEYKVMEQDLAKVPEWLPDKDNPPLAVPEAVKIAIQTAKEDYPSFDDFMLTSIQFMQAGSHKNRNRWFYVINLYPEIDGNPQIGSQITVVALMNRTVVKPLLRKPDNR